MGALLGAAQAWSLRGAVPHPWRWVAANAAAWAPAMAVIFLGASTPGADWPLSAVVGIALVTGAAAGAVLGVVTGWFLPSLVGTSVTGRLVLWRLDRPHPGRLADHVVGLDVRGRRTGRHYRFPVEYAADGDALVVVPGHPEAKTWWRNLDTRTPVDGAAGRCVVPGRGERAAPLRHGVRRGPHDVPHGHPRLRLPADQPVVRLSPERGGGEWRRPGGCCSVD